MSSIDKSDPIIKFFQKIEPIVLFFKKFDNSEMIGLVVAGLFFISVVAYWYYVCFMNGAKSWSEGIIKFHKKIGYPTIEFLVSPIVLKVFITIFLLATIGGLFGMVLSMLQGK